MHNERFPTIVTSGILPMAAVAIAAAIFVVDAIAPAEIAVSALYIPVVLLAARFCQQRGVLLASLGCIALSVLGHFLAPGNPWAGSALTNRLLGLVALGLATFLVLKNQSAGVALRQRAQLLDLTHDTIIVRDMNDIITYWNSGAKELYGWSMDEAVGSVTHDLLQTIFPVPLEEITAKLFRTGHWEGELVHRMRDGTRVIVASRWSVQRDERARPVAILETSNDVTEPRQTQEALHQAQTELARVNRVMTLGVLTASIAHEINQPLSAILTNLNTCIRWLEDRTFDLAKARMAADRAVRDAERAADIVERIRALMTKTGFKKVEVDINGIVKEALVLVQSELLKRKVSVHADLLATLPPVIGDRVQLQQVIVNLVMNGIEAMESPIDGPKALAIKSRVQEADEVLVQVCDSGVGFNPQSIDRIFDAFVTTKTGGIGMGLAICRSIVEAHGGRIWASSNSPHGAIFQFTIPTKPVGNLERRHN
jgi:two-component system, LuxR family, sensor kinase FixL